MKDQGIITEELYEQIKSMGGQPLRLYGLAKVHKTEVPLRPVLSMPGSPYFKLSGEISKWLSVISQSKIRTSSKQTVENIKNVVLSENEIMISFDVTALYTNVPIKEEIREASEILYSGEYQTPPLDKEAFVELTELVSQNEVR